MSCLVSYQSAGTPGTFSLEVHSDTPGLRLDAMPAGRSKTIAGEWIQATAGGSHINTGTWKRNPRFHLKVLGGRTKLKITLTRPASVWKSQVNKDSLGCMIGFYVCKGPITNRDLSGNILYEDEPWSETPFVPTHSVSTPVNFELPPLEDEVPRHRHFDDSRPIITWNLCLSHYRFTVSFQPHLMQINSVLLSYR